MGTSKTEEFSAAHNEMATLAKALGHPARIAILDCLLKIDGCICGDIVNELPLSQPTVSQHLRELREAGIIKGTVEGKAICYCIDQTALVKLLGYFGQLNERVINQKNTCCEPDSACC